MTQFEQYKKIADQYKARCDTAYKDMSERLKLSCDLLNKLGIPEVTVSREDTKSRAEEKPVLTITINPNSNRSVYLSNGKESASLTSLSKEPKLYDLACRVWITRQNEIIQAITAEITKQIQEKRRYL